MTPEQCAGISAAIGVDQGAFTLEVDLAVAPGEVLAVLGPNGAGKTTMLRALVGLTRIDRGNIRINDVVLDSPTTDVFVEPSRRRIGVVFQEYRLFPHLSVEDNIAFGPRSTGAGKAASRMASQEWIDRLELGALRHRKPGDLSGGQAQRVALARALAVRPSALLLDEPLSALDSVTRQDVRTQLAAHLREFSGPTLLVTHDPIDALVLADRVVVLEGGRVTQSGTTHEVARRPATAYVASVMGQNLLRGTATQGTVLLDDGGVLHAPDASMDGRVLVSVRPSSILLHEVRPEGSARNVWSGVVQTVQPIGDRVRVSVAGDPSVVADVTRSAVEELGLSVGRPVWLSTKSTELEVYPA
jgi:molybdate transport system ATP-binding protein